MEKVSVGSRVHPDGWGFAGRLAAGDGESEFFLVTKHGGLETPVPVNITVIGNKPSFRQGDFFIRCLVEFVGGSSTKTKGWLHCKF